MTDERERILARIREALAVPAPVPGHHPAPAETPTKTPAPAGSAARQWLPRVGLSYEEHLDLFRRMATELKADFQAVDNREDLARKLIELKDREAWTKAGIHAGELTDFAARQLGLPLCRTDAGYGVGDLESCSVGITECDALVAQTGSVLITSRSAGGRALSVLPPHHVVLACRDQLLPDLPAAFAFLRQKYTAGYPSFISFITGPSRTGDIERILVLGAHGPRKLTILLLGSR